MYLLNKYMHRNFYLKFFFKKKVLLLKLHLVDMMTFEKKFSCVYLL